MGFTAAWDMVGVGIVGDKESASINGKVWEAGDPMWALEGVWAVEDRPIAAFLATFFTVFGLNTRKVMNILWTRRMSRPISHDGKLRSASANIR